MLIKELQSLALDVKVLTENREEIEIKIEDDDMTETAKDIGLLVGDEDPVSREPPWPRAKRKPNAPQPRPRRASRTSSKALPANRRGRRDRGRRGSRGKRRGGRGRPSIAAQRTPSLDSDGDGIARIGGLGDDVLDADVIEEEPAV